MSLRDRIEQSLEVGPIAALAPVAITVHDVWELADQIAETSPESVRASETGLEVFWDTPDGIILIRPGELPANVDFYLQFQHSEATS